MPDVSIVIVNYNTREPLRRCLQSIQAEHGDLDVQVVIVDNASKDNSAAMVREVMPEATLVEPGKNTWFSGGNNIGFQHTTSDTIYILNADTRLQPNGLQMMIAYLKAHPNVGAVTCRMEYPEVGLQQTCSRVPDYWDLLLGYTFLGVLLRSWRDQRRSQMWYSEWDRATTHTVEVGPGSNLLCRGDVIKKIKGFDERLKLYFTEDDLCKKILDVGYEIHFVGGALLLHEERASTSQVWRLASHIYFEFVGKSGKEHEITLADKRLAKIVKQCRDIPGYDLFQYYDEKGERQSVGSADVNAYLEEITGEPFTAKVFRTWGGSVLAIKYLCEECDDEPSEKICRECVKHVSQLLGNTKSVSLKYYIHPLILKAYISGKLIPMYQHSHATRSPYGLSREEQVLIELIDEKI